MWTYNIEAQRLTRTGYTAPGSINTDVVEQIFGNENMEADFHPDDIEVFKEDFEERKNNIGSSRRIFRMKNNKGNYPDAITGSPTAIASITATGIPSLLEGNTKQSVCLNTLYTSLI